MHAQDLADPITVEDARIVGKLDLEGRKLDHPLVLRNCYVEEEINLRQAEIPRIDLSGSHLWGLDAEQLRTKDDVDLDDIVTTGTKIALTGARIDGCLSLNNARLSNVNGWALGATGAVIAQDVLADGLTASGMVGLLNVQIKGRLDLDGAHLFNPGGIALSADNIETGTLSCSELTAIGAVSLFHGNVNGDINFSDATVSNSFGDALIASRLTVAGMAYFHNFAAHGTVRLESAQIGTGITFIDATLSCPVDKALNTKDIRVGTIFMFADSTARGQVNSRGAHVRGAVLFSGARLSDPGGAALDARSMTVEQELRIADCEADVVLLDDTQVNGNVVLTQTQLDRLSADAFVAAKDLRWNLTVTGDVWARGLRAGQDATFQGSYSGHVVLLDANVGGRLRFTGAELTTLDLEGVHAKTVRLRPHKAPDEVDLTNAKVGNFDDDPRTWPKEVWLRGFSYDLLQHDDAAKQRIEWVRRHPGGYTPDVYDTLAAAYKRAGRMEYARRVNIAKQSHRRTEFGPIGRAWNWLLQLTVGYGYRTSQAWLWLALLLAGGTAVFANATFVATAQTVEAFNPFVYAMDVMLPIVDLGQQKAWVPQGPAQYAAWGLIAAGWVLTTAVVAGLTNALKRD